MFHSWISPELDMATKMSWPLSSFTNTTVEVRNYPIFFYWHLIWFSFLRLFLLFSFSSSSSSTKVSAGMSSRQIWPFNYKCIRIKYKNPKNTLFGLRDDLLVIVGVL